MLPIISLRVYDSFVNMSPRWLQIMGMVIYDYHINNTLICIKGLYTLCVCVCVQCMFCRLKIYGLNTSQ